MKRAVFLLLICLNAYGDECDPYRKTLADSVEICNVMEDLTKICGVATAGISILTSNPFVGLACMSPAAFASHVCHPIPGKRDTVKWCENELVRIAALRKQSEANKSAYSVSMRSVLDNSIAQYNRMMNAALNYPIQILDLYMQTLDREGRDTETKEEQKKLFLLSRELDVNRWHNIMAAKKAFFMDYVRYYKDIIREGYTEWDDVDRFTQDCVLPSVIAGRICVKKKCEYYFKKFGYAGLPNSFNAVKCLKGEE